MLVACIQNFAFIILPIGLYSYLENLTLRRAEDVLLHQKILAEAKDPTKCPVIHVRYGKVTLMFELFAEILIQFVMNKFSSINYFVPKHLGKGV